MKDIKYIRDYYNKHYTDNLNFYWDKTKILNAFKTYEMIHDKSSGYLNEWVLKVMKQY